MKPIALMATLSTAVVGCGYWRSAMSHQEPVAVTSLFPEQQALRSGELSGLPGRQQQAIEAAPDSFTSTMPEVRFDDYPAKLADNARPDIAPGVIQNCLPGYRGLVYQGVTLWCVQGEDTSLKPVRR